MAHRNDPVLQTFEDAKAERQNWDALWQEIAELVLPRRDFTVQRQQGTKRHNRVYDSTALWAAGQLAAGLESFLINPQTKWFNLALSDKQEGDETQEVQEYLGMVRDRMLSVLNDPESNFYPAAHEGLLDVAAFGTMSLFVDDRKGKIRFQGRPLSEAYIMENGAGRIDTYYREYELTNKQAKDQFGITQLPDKIRKELDKNKLGTQHTYLQAIYPNGEFNAERAKTRDNKPWVSAHYLNEGKGQIITQSGFDQFPFIVARWSKVAGETYGRSPAMEVLPDIKMLQEMSKTVIKAAQKATDPPLMVPDDGFLGSIRTMPGGINYYRKGTRDQIFPIENRSRVDIGQDLIAERQQAVLRAFYVQALQGILQRGDSSPLKATEVVARQQQALRAISPVVSRLQSEFLVPLVDRLFALMLKRGDLPQPPEQLQGRDFDVKFVSQAATAQQSAAADNILSWLQQVLPVLELDPQAAANIETDKTVRMLGELQNVPQELLTDPEQVQELRQQQSQAEQANQLASLLKEGGSGLGALADTAKTISETRGGDE